MTTKELELVVLPAEEKRDVSNQEIAFEVSKIIYYLIFDN